MSNYRDDRGRPLVAVTGTGVVTSLGIGKTDNWAALTAGSSGIKKISRFATDGLRTTIAGTVDFLAPQPRSAPALSVEMALCAAQEALGEAAIGSSGSFPGPLFLATPPAELEWPQRKALYDTPSVADLSGYKRLVAAARDGDWRDFGSLFQFASVADHIAASLGTRGLPISVSTACASGATAIQLGVEAIRRGETEVALCIGTDTSVQIEALIRFSLLSALSTRNEPADRASRPFSKDRDGFVMAEGAAALVLESYQSAKARGASILGFVRGCGEKADTYHRTRSKPDGTAIIGAIRNALDDAGVDPDEIDYINAHGTSTPENDKMEYISLKAVLGEHLAATPISSNKSMIGHTLSAAGAIEAVFSLLTIRNGTLPPTINYALPDPEIPLDVVANVSRPASVHTVLSNSFGFGGQNVSLVLAAP
ncbi:MAG: beta-ketoacyl-ACP synthase [Hyphomicrobium sp.]|uniref:beta-ketoacyl-ACP synthase n=1 Tax=Hyphomicrobium sp. TaxID=82 RepID=UPI001328897E|nr:beta-ketoacyl-ACP synthase [Hyphomicrobium sp.]KAB2943147.1 MAG: beta-ketoacyl-ACP synthase [Hyphomicrobium sp.]MBZ0209041.1 beta-ketoacyl-ACP synthase [Hyphomicrobium sp.]